MIFLLFLTSCSDKELELINTQVVKGIVSAKDPGHVGRIATWPIIYVQNNKQTKIISIPFQNENDYKIGDSVILIIQKYKEIEND